MATPKFIQGSPHFIRVTTLAGSPTPQKNSPPHHIFTQFEKQQFPKKFEIFLEMFFDVSNTCYSKRKLFKKKDESFLLFAEFMCFFLVKTKEGSEKYLISH